MGLFHLLFILLVKVFSSTPKSLWCGIKLPYMWYLAQKRGGQPLTTSPVISIFFNPRQEWVHRRHHQFHHLLMEADRRLYSHRRQSLEFRHHLE